MTSIVSKVSRLIASGKVRVSLHAVQELVNDGLFVEPLIDGIDKCQVVEEYPDLSQRAVRTRPSVR